MQTPSKWDLEIPGPEGPDCVLGAAGLASHTSHCISVMVSLVCQLDWVLDAGLDVVSAMSVRAFPGWNSIRLGGLSKAVALLKMGRRHPVHWGPESPPRPAWVSHMSSQR